MGVITFILGLNLFAADTPPVTPAPPVTIHLELAKDTLALAEPTMLTMRIQNNQDSSLLLDVLRMHPFDRFYLYLIKPNGEEWLFGHGSRILGDYFSASNKTYNLSGNESVTVDQFLWWPDFAPALESLGIEDFNPGPYKIWETFSLPGYKDKIFSDTISFVFLPANETSLDALKLVCRTSVFFHSGQETRTNLEQIRDSGTPYSEGAWAYLISTIWDDSDSLKTEIDLFDTRYPSSSFRVFLLMHQFLACVNSNTIRKSRLDLNPTIERTKEVDSLLTEWERATPQSIWMLYWKNRISSLPEEEAKTE